MAPEGDSHVLEALFATIEHTFTLTPEGAWVLTALDGGEQRLKDMGVPFGGH